jgi:hypothetical protein
MEAITMRHNIVRKSALITGGAAAALLLAGCGGGGTADSPSQDVPTSQSSPSTSTAKPLPEAQSEPTAAANDAECKVADLSLSLSDGEGTAGTYYRYLVFTNKGNRTCTIQGFPGVSYVTGDDGRQVGPAAERQGTKQPPVTLKPGDHANVTIGFRDVGAFDEAACQPTQTRGLRVYPPHEYKSMFVPADGLGCAGKDLPESQLTVTSILPGTKPA